MEFSTKTCLWNTEKQPLSLETGHMFFSSSPGPGSLSDCHPAFFLTSSTTLPRRSYISITFYLLLTPTTSIVMSPHGLTHHQNQLISPSPQSARAMDHGLEMELPRNIDRLIVPGVPYHCAQRQRVLRPEGHRWQQWRGRGRCGWPRADQRRRCGT